MPGSPLVCTIHGRGQPPVSTRVSKKIHEDDEGKTFQSKRKVRKYRCFLMVTFFYFILKNSL